VRIDRAVKHIRTVFAEGWRNNPYRLPARLFLGIALSSVVVTFGQLLLGAVEVIPAYEKGDAFYMKDMCSRCFNAIGASCMFIFLLFPPLHANVREIYAARL
jgi:hypothetical protein